ncbi:hypothetical protein PFICI_06442 [Pestalotiopsis fici W106-1]|uniref:F-box domain-containing protein n=1 Tax=Pestalotiopsis fici (strain W106-1 / CGMCC3.15140) TaxID=1229662 RepID=W3X5V9_PESFW|nr:uncharacterized protein PFICI_06442 [Pestalotiopsis fici W106-1]ETS81440.1 hypothetical protein PFICI_06442 [Pestalotiopsis fici W106-1]
MQSMQQMVSKGTACYQSGDLIAASRQFRQLHPPPSSIIPGYGYLLTLSHLLFRQAAQSCKCEVGKPNLECKCIDFLQACHDHTLSEALRQSCTCPRRAAKRCKDESHAVALGSLVLVCIKTKDYKLGLIYGQNLIRIAPRDPRGYLRLGQLLRLTKKQATALAVYQQGIALVARANPQHPGLVALQEQEKTTSKALIQIDPVHVLPTELFIQVLRNLKTKNYCGILRVSKSWKTFIERTRGLWTEQEFYVNARIRPTRLVPPSKPIPAFRLVPASTIQKCLVTYPGGQLQSLTIRDCAAFPLLINKLATILRACPHLRHLSLAGSAALRTGYVRPESYKGPQLKTLYLGPNLTIDNDVVQYLMPNNCESLEELSLLGMPQGPFFLDPAGPQYPRLHTLRLAGPSNQGPYPICMLTIAHMAPSIQVVSLDRVSLYFHEWQDVATINQWHNLKSLSMGKDIALDMSRNFPTVLVKTPFLPEELEELVLTNTALRWNFSWEPERPLEWGQWVVQPPHSPKPYFPSLKTLVVRDMDHHAPKCHDKWKSLIAPSVASDKLRHLEICPFPWPLVRDLDQTRQWLEPEAGATGITALGISCLMASVGHEIDDADDALLQLVQLFPNLRDLDINQEPIGLSTLARILEAGVDRIYHRQGAAMLTLKEWAQSKGKDVIHGSMPRSSLVL